MVANHRTETAFSIILVVNHRTETTLLLKWSQTVVLKRHFDYFSYKISTLNHAQMAFLSNSS